MPPDPATPPPHEAEGRRSDFEDDAPDAVLDTETLRRLIAARDAATVRYRQAKERLLRGR
ncbi:MAG TPA: hypothetical protein VEG27_02870 [Usitatibacter sp.]|nr:hypothetical protein [Usitatibacter sp.]